MARTRWSIKALSTYVRLAGKVPKFWLIGTFKLPRPLLNPNIEWTGALQNIGFGRFQVFEDPDPRGLCRLEQHRAVHGKAKLSRCCLEIL